MYFFLLKILCITCVISFKYSTLSFYFWLLLDSIIPFLKLIYLSIYLYVYQLDNYSPKSNLSTT